MRILGSVALFMVLFGFASPLQAAPSNNKKPNVLIFLLDDVGFGQLEPFGGLIETPNIKSVADRGLRFTNFHTTALCSPTRAALLTGRNHHSVATGNITEMATNHPGYTAKIPKSAGSIAALLGTNGYRTFALGKWHNTPLQDVTTAGPFDRWPTGLGFERFYGFMGAETNQWQPTLWENTTPVETPKDPNYHFTQDIASKAVTWLRDAHEETPEKPFFLYFATGAAHAPHHAPIEYIKKYDGRFRSGWDKAREEIFSRQKSMGLFHADTLLGEKPDVIPDWDSLPRKEQALFGKMQEVFAAYVDHTDHEFGRILKTLAELGELDNTIIIIASDNGASGEGSLIGSVNEYRMWNGIEESLELNLSLLGQIGGRDTFNHYPAGWALAGNTPFRYWKQTVHEGGVRDPLIISWPQGIGDQGAVRGVYSHVVDIVPTLLDVLQITPPEKLNGVKQMPFEGQSFAKSWFAKDSGLIKRTQYYEMFGNRGVWVDGWKAVTFHGRWPWQTGNFPSTPFDDDVWELYYTADDPTEMNNLAEIFPAQLDKLKDIFDAEARKHHVYPLDDRTTVRNQEFAASILGDKTHFEYDKSDYRIPELISPPVKNRSHSITARVTIAESGAEGVIATVGGRFGGYALYVKDGRLHYLHNYIGESKYLISSDEPLPSGQIELRFVFTKTGENQGVGELFINGESVGRGDLPRTVPLLYSATETFDVGRDTGSAAGDYEIPAVFTGEIESVTVDLL